MVVHRYSIMCKILKIICFAFLLLGPHLFSDQSWNIYLGTHRGPSSIYYDLTSSDPSSFNYLNQFVDGNGSYIILDQVSDYDGNYLDGDRIELGFFDVDDTSTITPNTDSSNPFKGEWTPLTSQLRIGYDKNSTDHLTGGLFSYKLNYNNLGTPGPADGKVIINEGKDNSILDDALDSYSATNFGDSPSYQTNDLSNRINALSGASSDAYIGIRFYDDTNRTSGVTRYNTIMNTNWQFKTNTNDVTISLHDTSGNTTSGLLFEFNNTDYGSGLSKIGTGDYNLPSNDFVTTITYYDGSGTLNMDNTGGIGDTILSGLNSGGDIDLGDDANILTINSAGGNDYLYSGTIDGNGSILKTGAGGQTLTGAFDIAGSNTGFIKIYEGNLTLAPTSASSQFAEYITGGTANAVLELNNTGVGTDQLVQLGFANSSSADFNGSVILSGTGSETKIKISNSTSDGSFASSDYNDSQTFSGVISNENGNKELVKDGAGILVLDNTNTFTGGVEILDGTLVAGENQALGNTSNTVTITKGKLEVDSGVTLNSGYTINTTNGQKSMIGGKGTLNKAITIGDANSSNFVDVISPGSGISSSLSSFNSMQQVSLGDRTNAIGTFTVSDTLTLENGGVYDWEISDFTGTAGTDWDLLKFDALNFSPSDDSFTINIMSLDANGEAGAMAGGNVWQNYTSNGFKFMEFTGAVSWTGNGALTDDGYVSGFNIVDDGWSYHNTHHLHNWNVWYDHSEGDFYLQYSVAPEPSTYVMVTGLMLVPGMGAVRKYRNRKKKESAEDSTPEISV